MEHIGAALPALYIHMSPLPSQTASQHVKCAVQLAPDAVAHILHTGLYTSAWRGKDIFVLPAASIKLPMCCAIQPWLSAWIGADVQVVSKYAAAHVLCHRTVVECWEWCSLAGCHDQQG